MAEPIQLRQKKAKKPNPSQTTPVTEIGVFKTVTEKDESNYHQQGTNDEQINSERYIKMKAKLQKQFFESNQSESPVDQGSRLTQPLKWHGGKHYTAKKIIELMPPHTHYVEPFFGGGSVLLNKTADDISEVANDIHGELTDFWRVLQDETRRKF